MSNDVDMQGRALGQIAEKSKSAEIVGRFSALMLERNAYRDLAKDAICALDDRTQGMSRQALMKRFNKLQEGESDE